MLMHQLVEDGANRHPDRLAFLWPDRDVALTYVEAAIIIERVAGGLAELGVGRGDRVGIFAHNGADYLMAMFGAFRLGAVAALINVTYADKLDYFVNDCTPKVLIYTGDHHLTIEQHRPVLRGVEHYVCLDGPEGGSISWPDLLENPSPLPALTARETDIAHLSYTSGTTGDPKGACLAHEPTLRATRCIAERLRLGAGDVSFGPTALSSSYNLVANLLPALHRGATTCVTRAWDIESGWSIMEEHSVTILAANPPILADVLREATRIGCPPRSLRLSLSGGGPVPPALKAGWQGELRIPLVESYGQSEIGGFVALGQPEPAENRRLAAVGRQLPDKEVRIFNDVDEELPIGSTGEIVLRGGFMKAYWNRPDKTEETLRGGWLHTGDVGFMDEDGFVFFRGRLSERLLVDGEYWYPRDLEEALLGHPEVKEAALVGAPDANLGMRPVAFVMTTDGLGSGFSFAGYLRDRVHVDVSFLSVRRVESMPYTPTGKVSYAELRKLISAEDHEAAG